MSDAHLFAAASTPLSTRDKCPLLRLVITGLLASIVLAVPSGAQARITKIAILSSGTAFGGYSFAGVGTYQVLRGYAIDAVDPFEPQNAVITDIQLASKDSNGKVNVVFNFYILMPSDPAKGNAKMMYEPVNRGNKTFGVMNNTPTFPIANDPASITDSATLADSFLWTRGYTTVWSGWEYEGDPTQATNLSESAGGLATNGTPLTSMRVAYGPGNSALIGPRSRHLDIAVHANNGDHAGSDA
jgi:hypothetical protein